MTSINVSSVELLVFNSAIYIFAFFIVVIGLRGLKVRATSHEHTPVRETLLEGWGFVREVPSFRYLMTLSLCGRHRPGDYSNFTSSASPTQSSKAAVSRPFTACYRIVGTLGAFLIQTFITGRILQRINLKDSFLHPAQHRRGWPAAVMIAFAGHRQRDLWLSSAARLGKQTIDESANKSLLALVPEERRGRVSFFMDSYLFASGMIIGCIITGIIVFIGKLTGSTTYFYCIWASR